MNPVASFLLLSTLLLLGACRTSPTGSDADSALGEAVAWSDAIRLQRIATAERFFRGVYGGDPAVVDELAAEDVIVSYPIFEEVFGVPALRGRDRVREFVQGFATRWTDAEFELHEAIADSGGVALLWSFRARSTAADADGGPQAWGGITFYRFDASGRILAEVGEESTPGPAMRSGMVEGSGDGAPDALDSGTGDDMADDAHSHHALDYVEFAVADTAAAREFYAAALGWQFNDYGPEYSGIRKVAGDGESGGLRLDAAAPAGGPVPGLWSDDLDATYAAVKAAGGTITVEPFAFPGGRRFQFRDPDGNELIVYSGE